LYSFAFLETKKTRFDSKVAWKKEIGMYRTVQYSDWKFT